MKNNCLNCNVLLADNKRLSERNRELETFHASYNGEPTNFTDPDIEQLQKENERLRAEREQLIDQHISELADLHVKITSIEHDYLEYKALKEYGNENGDEK